jgi:hypothetical protein
MTGREGGTRWGKSNIKEQVGKMLNITGHQYSASNSIKRS